MVQVDKSIYKLRKRRIIKTEVYSKLVFYKIIKSNQNNQMTKEIEKTTIRIVE